MYHVGSPSWNEHLETIREALRANSSVHCNTHGARCSPLNVAFCCLCCFLPFSRPGDVIKSAEKRCEPLRRAPASPYCFGP